MVFLRPNADDVDGNWLNQAGNNTDLYTSLDETSASDTDYIYSPANPIAEVCRVALENPAGALAEPFVLRYRFNNVGGAELTVRLMQGATEIASWAETATGWTTQERTLTTPQFSAITDFSDLFIELSADAGGDPTLALNLDLTVEPLDSRVTFTRASPATYFNASGLLATASSGVPRVNYNSALVARGLLLEEQRTNFMLQSNVLDNAYWGALAGLVITTGTYASPTGANNAWQFEASGGATEVRLFRDNVAGLTSGDTFTISVFAKKGGASPSDYVYLQPMITSSLIGTAYFNLVTGNWGTVTGSGILATFKEPLANGWHRLGVMAAHPGGAVDLNGIFFGFCDADNNTFWTGGRTGLAYGVQFEAGGSVSSYSNTTSAAVTRAADAAVMTGTDFSSWWNASAGTFVAASDLITASGTRPIISVDDNAANERIELVAVANYPKAIVTDGGVVQADLSAGIPTGGGGKLGLSFAANDFAVSFGGATAVVDTGGSLPTATQARIGADQAGNFLQGHVSSLQFYDVAKTDVELQTLTARAAPAVIEQVGSTVQIYASNTSANTGTAGTVTVPVDADFVTVVVSGYHSTPGYFSGGSMTFTKGGSQVAMASAGNGADTLNCFQTAMFYLALPDTGASKSVEYDWFGTATSTDAVRNYAVTFWKGVDTASPVRDSDGAHSTSAPTGLNTPSLTAQSGDLIFAAYGGYVAAQDGSGAVTAWSNLIGRGEVGHHDYAEISLATGSPSGTTTVGVTSVTGYSEGGLIAIVLKPAT